MKENPPSKWKASLMQSGEYEAMYHSENDMWWYKGLRDTLRYTLKDYKNAVIIDSGCGTGKNMEFFAGLGHEVHGFDISEEAVHFCHSRGLKNVVVGDITTVNYPNEYADVILSMDVLVLLYEEDIDVFMNRAYEILKKGGKLLIHVAALPALYSQHDIVCNVKRRYTKKTIKALLNQYPFFEIKKISYRMFFLFPLIAAVKGWKKIQKRTPKSDQGTPPRFINFILTQIQYLENFCLRYINFPIGSSLYLVLEKK
jgi:SAM-dependent methyltransferase